MLIRTSLIVAALAVPASGSLKITEIMYDADGNNEFEYIELYNSGPDAIDLTGWVFARDLNQAPGNGANVLAGAVPARGTAVLIRADGSSGTSGRTLEGFRVAWEQPSNPSINFIPVARWPVLTNSTAGAGLGLWSSLADYTADHTTTFSTTPAVFTYTNAAYATTYAVGSAFGWPASNDSASIYLRDVSADETNGANWALSVAGVDGAYAGGSGSITVGSNTVNVNRTGDVGSPGIIPEPGAAALAGVALLMGLRRRA